jgi:hypothetical protein
MSKLLVTVPEAAALAISRNKLHELMATGLVRSVRMHGSCERQRATLADADDMPTAEPRTRAERTEWQALPLARPRRAQQPADRPATRRRAT